MILNCSKGLGLYMVCLMFVVCVLEIKGHKSISKRQASPSECSPQPSDGTTPNIEQIFKGRCSEFKNLLITSETCPGVSVDCIDAWQKFSGAFVGKDPCNISATAYDEFLKAVPIVFPADTTLFWSGTNALAHDFTDVNEILYTLEQSMLGYLTNGLDWCSTTDSSNPFSEDPCPSWDADSCPNTATGVYWSSASTMLGSQSRGVATVLLNGSSPWDSFNSGSFFAKYELPNLDPNKVTNLRIIVAHDLGGPVNEQCGTETVKVLQDLVDDYGLSQTCEETPESVRLLQCVSNADHEECTFANDAGRAHNINLNKFMLFVIGMTLLYL